MILPHLLRRDRCKTNTVGNSPSIPGLPDAKAVHLAYLHIGHHLGWRNGNEGDVFVGVNAPGGQPVAHPHRMRTRRIGHRKGQWRPGLLGSFYLWLEGLWGLDPLR